MMTPKGHFEINWTLGLNFVQCCCFLLENKLESCDSRVSIKVLLTVTKIHFVMIPVFFLLLLIFTKNPWQIRTTSKVYWNNFILKLTTTVSSYYELPIYYLLTGLNLCKKRRNSMSKIRKCLKMFLIDSKKNSISIKMQK